VELAVQPEGPGGLRPHRLRARGQRDGPPGAARRGGPRDARAGRAASSLEVNLVAMEILEAARTSARTGQAVRLQP
jgi:hypothetical protein